MSYGFNNEINEDSAMCEVSDKTILICLTSLGRREGGDGGLSFKVCLGVLLGSEGRRRAAARR